MKAVAKQNPGLSGAQIAQLASQSYRGGGVRGYGVHGYGVRGYGKKVTHQKDSVLIGGKRKKSAWQKHMKAVAAQNPGPSGAQIAKIASQSYRR